MVRLRTSDLGGFSGILPLMRLLVLGFQGENPPDELVLFAPWNRSSYSTGQMFGGIA
ncbi:MAG: hypothetical protein DDT26_00562 [Dehalococcoidia bacterium]|nr:hypothetical protein [Chloroflexota bacterium]